MLTAIPVNRGTRVSNHFVKSSEFLLFNPEGGLQQRLSNPVSEGKCNTRHELITELKSQDVQNIIVRHIGQRMLTRLLQAGFSIFQVPAAIKDAEIETIFSRSDLVQLTNPEQGSPSPAYEKKRESGLQCCSRHEDHEAQGKSCCGHTKRHQGGHSCCSQRS